MVGWLQSRDVQRRVSKLFAESADGSRLKIRGRKLTQIINKGSALDKLTHRAQWADAIVLTDALYPSQSLLPWHDHAPQLQPLTALQCPSHVQMDWTHGCGWGLWGSGQKASYGLANWQRIRHSICLRTRICGQNPRTDADAIFWYPHMQSSARAAACSCTQRLTAANRHHV